MGKYTLAIHGGAGTITRTMLTQEVENDYKNALNLALIAGNDILKKGGIAADAVEAAVKVMEDSPLFNAGKGAVYSSEGTHEMECSIMCGKTLQAGAVAGIKLIKNPIALARKVLYDENFVYISGEGAEKYAQKYKLEFVENSYFDTPHRYEQWQAVKDTDLVLLDHDADNLVNDGKGGDYKFGTAGAVAMDSYGNLAAATSTGGLTNKKFGRLGDSSMIGGGTYANNKTCAISCTGYGEYFIRSVVAHDISCLMEYKGLSLKQACEYVVKDKLVKIGGEGGLCAVDSLGNIELCFNSEGMYRGQISSDDMKFHVAIYES
ncbi:MAG: isoaspartyl peptidase/L-asparaginase [Bacteroidetes bacterium]|nr:MAG: isoaspartyl peptidase/L-asparaginase [Bacteroidota bacterium]